MLDQGRCLTFDQRGYLTIAATEEQITLPMAGYCSILCCGWAFANGNRLDNPSVVVRLLRMVVGTTHRPSTPQVCQQLFLQGTPRLNEKRALDGLV